MTKILVDTTYLLPLAGIDVEHIPRDAIRQVQARGHELFVAQISLFELLAKGAKLAFQDKAEPQRIVTAVQSVLKDESLRKLDGYDIDTSRTAIELRRRHPDFVDCLILAAALKWTQGLLTEDPAFTQPSRDLKEFISRANPHFRIVSFKSVGGM